MPAGKVLPLAIVPCAMQVFLSAEVYLGVVSERVLVAQQLVYTVFRPCSNAPEQRRFGLTHAVRVVTVSAGPVVDFLCS